MIKPLEQILGKIFRKEETVRTKDISDKVPKPQATKPK